MLSWTLPAKSRSATFLVNDPAIDAGVRANYRARNLIRLPSSSRVRDGAGTIVSQSELRYDEAAYAPLGCGAAVGWADPGTSVRGMATTTRSWLDMTGGWLETHAQYDQCGNVRNSWDAKGNLSQVEYTDSFSDGVGRNTFAYPTRTVSPVPDPTGAYGSASALVSTTAYDFSTGLVTSTTDANGKTTTFTYNDPLNRLKRVDRPDGGRTTHTYVDAHQCGAYVETRTLLDSTGREAAGRQFFDGLGRPYLSETDEYQDPSRPFLRVDTIYDSAGRVSRVSNPYRSPGCTVSPDASLRTTT